LTVWKNFIIFVKETDRGYFLVGVFYEHA
jgi:hypothetical protein